MLAQAQTLGHKIGLSAACGVLGVPRSSFYRHHQPRPEPNPRPQPAWALSVAEKDQVHQILNSPRFVDMPPRQVYATLLDEGTYLCHWRTMYRILHSHQEVKERRHQRQHPPRTKPRLQSTGPNQLWSWDITHLRGPHKHQSYYLYVIVDVYSRFVVGWLLAEVERAELAHTLIHTTCQRQGIQPQQLGLHSDRGAAMQAQTIAQLLDKLKISQTFTRPYTPNDNPYSEAHFKTLKYRPHYPQFFPDLSHARAWCQDFFQWYNFEHYHSALQLLTPASVHYEHASDILAQRQLTLAQAYQAHPQRFRRGQPALHSLPDSVWINPPQNDELAEF
jgi:putative transposase